MTTNTQDLVEKLFEKGVLVSKEMLEKGVSEDLIGLLEEEEDLMVLNEDYTRLLEDGSFLVDWYEIDSLRVGFEKDPQEDELYQSHLQGIQKGIVSVSTLQEKQQEIISPDAQLNEETLETSFETKNISQKQEIEVNAEGEIELLEKLNKELSFEVVVSYETISQKYTVRHFSDIFLSRYKFVESILRSRSEMSQLTSISRVLQKKEKETVNVIGLVFEIAETRNGNIILTLEDPTGHIKILISKNNPQLLQEAKDLVFDEVIGIVGTSGQGIIFANKIVWPDIPSDKELKKAPIEEYAIFLSDIHVGSTYFLEEAFEKLLKWINGEVGNDVQKELAANVKYIFIAGDLVDGIGIYAAQEEELTINTVKGQYDEFTRLLKKIPSDKQIFICPGNHDMVHLAEPQPVFYKEYTQDLHDMPNVTLVSNPSAITIAKTKEFEGINVLMYHGYSFDFYVANVDSIRNNGGYRRADLIMEFLLKRRHLAPTFKSTPYLPAYKEDPLLIRVVPDIFLTGHIHYSAVANYKGVTTLSGSCWQACTKFQEKLGHEPEPGRVPLINLKTREIKVLKFV
jgi:DNA polymerase II small subunit